MDWDRVQRMAEQWDREREEIETPWKRPWRIAEDREKERSQATGEDLDWDRVRRMADEIHRIRDSKRVEQSLR